MATPARPDTSTPSLWQWMGQKKLLTIVGLPVLLALTWAGFLAAWGLLFIWWALLSVNTGQAFVFEEIRRDETPLLFWVIIAMWIGFGLLYVVNDLAPYVLS